jgi:hypothetical protein
MAAHHDPLPVDLDACHPHFSKKVGAMNFRTQSEIKEIIAETKRTIAASMVVLAEADRALDKKR